MPCGFVTCGPNEALVISGKNPFVDFPCFRSAGILAVISIFPADVNFHRRIRTPPFQRELIKRIIGYC